MDKSIIFRKATQEDAIGITSVQIRSWRETYSNIVPKKYLNSLDINKKEKTWSEKLSKPGSTTLVAECGELVGFINFGISREKTDYDGEIYSLYLLKEYKGKGIGKKLFLGAVRNMADIGLKSFYLWVIDKNPSKGFYEKMGGTIIDEKDVEIGGAILKEVAYGWKSLNFNNSLNSMISSLEP